jgi:hypothetical protein
MIYSFSYVSVAIVLILIGMEQKVLFIINISKI